MSRFLLYISEVCFSLFLIDFSNDMGCLSGGIASSIITIFVNEMVIHQNRVVHGASGMSELHFFMSCYLIKYRGYLLCDFIHGMCCA